MATYNANTDYRKLMNEAAKQGNFQQAAIYEQQRNAKIAGEGLSYAPTNLYQNYLQQQAPEYESPYAGQIQEAISDLRGTSWGGWTPEGDESYAAYRKQYLREADRNTENTMGEYAAMTGGVPSSAAITAAQQAGDYYRGQLADKVPELYQNAYQRYLNDISAKQQNLTQLMAADAQNEASYYNRINEAMNKWGQMGYADADVAGVLGVGVGTPTRDQAYTNWTTAFEAQKYQDALDAAAAEAAAKQQKAEAKAAAKAATAAEKAAKKNEGNTGMIRVSGLGMMDYATALNMVNNGFAEVTGYSYDEDGNEVPVITRKR